MLESTLIQIGLEKKQAKIYLACLELGITSIREISLKSGVKRTTIYDIIYEMIDSGFIKTTKIGKKDRFVAIEPNELKIILKRKAALLDEILPDLRAINNVSKNKPKFWFYQGTEGLKKAYNDTLRYREIAIYQWASNDIFGSISDKWLFNYVKQRVKRKIKAQAIASDSEEVREFKKNDKVQLRETRLVDPKEFPFQIEMDLYKNRVAMISGKDKIAVIIESEPIVKHLKMVFKLCWKSLK